ncbi:TVP38/TMEM64 family inner membrane protein YdjZ [Pseudodesulfovibrio hydrargyri]|uniref:TVP38/TMEM64 family membrane protein n=1 Tax=Pseudodesulfovibrio hydrargyri TaxID=2125990 RepID=A0A1J5MZ70_9BACT|nr:TVP38/TMEM64 family protein [Pseudodesulfovibrio hydrargyri]OIQ51821.1 TVP38/TMEM64 family inner membrane protein YdjZ [Pseudodesulfovibrio hydrargyri]
MARHGKKTSRPWPMIIKFAVVLGLLGLLSLALEHWGERYMSRVTEFVADQGELAPLVFIAVNALLTLFLVPQVLFTVAAGALFGWKFGAAYASAGMTIGATMAFLLARYGVRERLRARFAGHPVYRRMLSLSRVHPLHLISLSRIIPVLPFPATSYLLGITEVRCLPYALLSWLAMLPETIFLASGGHLLTSGVRGHVSAGAAVALGVAGVAVAFTVHRMKKTFLKDEEIAREKSEGDGEGKENPPTP